MNIVITGASKGLGFTLAETFAADGGSHNFFLCARNKEALQQAAHQLQTRFPQTKVLTYACDISQKNEVTAFAGEVKKQMPDIDVLINNAGTFLPGSFSEEPDDRLEAMMQINFYSAYYLTKALLPTLKKRKGGHIFNICSIASRQALPASFSYSLSKVALMGFSKNLREELKGDNIKVTAVYPGAFVNDSREAADNNWVMEAKDIANMMYAATQLSANACVEEIILRPQQGQ